MEAFKLFFEERTRSDINQKKSTWEHLEKYILYDDSNDTFTIEKRGKKLSFNADDVYIHFGTEFKVGINPHSEFDVTPLGIYCYHLKTVWDIYKLKNNPMTNLPFAGASPFCWVVIYTDKESKLVSNMTKDDLLECYPTIKKFFFDRFNYSLADIKFKSITDSIKNGNFRSFFHAFWILTEQIAEACGGTGKKALYWNVLLRQCGYVGFNDFGHGIIFEDEPFQTVFLQKDVLKPIDVIHNKYFYDVDKQFLEFMSKNKQYFRYDNKQLPLLLEFKDLIYKLKFWSGGAKLVASETDLSITGYNAFSMITGLNITSDINYNFYSLILKNSKLNMWGSSFNRCDFVNSEVVGSNVIIRSAETKNSVFKHCTGKILTDKDEVRKNNTFIGCEFV